MVPCCRIVPDAVVRGLQLSLGLSLAKTGVKNVWFKVTEVCIMRVPLPPSLQSPELANLGTLLWQTRLRTTQGKHGPGRQLRQITLVMARGII